MRVLNIGDDVWITEHLQTALDAGVARVKRDVGRWVDGIDLPTPELNLAVLRYVQVMRVNAPDDGWRALTNDHIYQEAIHGYRRRFGVA